MSMDGSPDPESLTDLKSLVKDLMPRRPWIYWSDLVASASLSWISFLVAARRADWDLLRCGLLLVCGLALLRAVLFIHELSHLRRGGLPGFSTAWNLVIGIPVCVPSFMYVGTHTDHHRRNVYGTGRDPEYLPLALLSRWSILIFVLGAFISPVLLVIRYAVMTPVSWVVPPLRRFIIRRASTLAINPRYERAMPHSGDLFLWFALEAGVLVYTWVVAWMIWSGRMSWDIVVQWYVVVGFVSVANQVRTLAAHLYERDEEELTTTEQLLDSVNLGGGGLLEALIAPVGLRYHALHHFIADMPYHSLGRAHRRLMRDLPPESEYRQAEHRGMFPVLDLLVRHPREKGGGTG